MLQSSSENLHLPSPAQPGLHPNQSSAPSHLNTNHIHLPLICSLITLTSKAHTSPHSSVRSRLYVLDSFSTPTKITSKTFSVVSRTYLLCFSACSPHPRSPWSPCLSHPPSRRTGFVCVHLSIHPISWSCKTKPVITFLVIASKVSLLSLLI